MYVMQTLLVAEETAHTCTMLANEQLTFPRRLFLDHGAPRSCARLAWNYLACRHTLAFHGFDIVGPTPPHGNVLAPRVHNKAAQKTKRQNNTTYSGFGGALAYGYGFRITRSAFGIVAVFGAQNSFCHLGVP